ncbi:polysaccharide biosynthesis protein [Flavobacterium sp. LS1R10]|uniref:polysaccharide biosynthesis protein n=1 Tax=Flavobacterium sp. LS1R10 TaxID=2497482 RepID=UPI0018F52072|nr:polysaccharide biosynthesis protein [Flavobacterium sp. LS1R10]
MGIFKGKNLLITGGTGSFGQQVIESLIDSDIQSITVYSRDESKQETLRNMYSSDKLRFIIGDVRDKRAISDALENIDYVFHAAALKQVPSCEFNPVEAVKTNILGTQNVLDSACEKGVKKVICLSTDKSVLPVNAMGMSKALMEKVAVAKARSQSKTIISVTRYGNVLYSRGSVVPLFRDKILNNSPLPITEPSMTRFIMTLKEAMDLVFFAFENSEGGEIFVQKSPACRIDTLALAMKKLYKSDVKIEQIGIRHGEKMFEALLSAEEFSRSEDMINYFKILPDSRDLNYQKYLTNGDLSISQFKEYNSINTIIYDVDDVCKKLLEVDQIRKDLGIK